MKICSFLVPIACTFFLAGCSVAPTEPHLVTALEANGGPMGNAVAGAVKNRQSNNSMSQGIGQCLYTTQICNTGTESKGLRISANGDAITTGKIRNLVVLVESRGTPENTIYRTMYLQKADRGPWTAYTLMPIKTQNLKASTVSEKCDQVLNVTLYGDLVTAGSGNLDIEISPYETTQQAPVKSTQTLRILAEHSSADNLFSIPGDFPLTSYPGSTFASGSRSKIGASVLTITLKTKDLPEQVLQYYKNECAGRGFCITNEPPGSVEARKFTASNGIYEINLDANKNKDDKVTSIVFKVNAASNVPVDTLAPAATTQTTTVTSDVTTNTPNTPSTFTPPITGFDTKP